MLLYKMKKIQPEKGNWLLISITIAGSTGPIRFVVNEKELVANVIDTTANVIDTTMKNYAREGSLPVLGSNLNDFVLYCPTVATEVLCPWETIGSFGVGTFVLVKKPQVENPILDGKQVVGGRDLEVGGHGSINHSVPR